MHKKIALLTSLVVATPQLASAQGTQPPSPEEILVTGQRQTALTIPSETGSRLGLTPLETPASVNSLLGEEIRLRGDLNLIDAVTRAPGVTSVANPGNGGTALAARGFNGQGSVLQLVDGIRLFPVAGTITFPTDPWMVERIEVLNGPASVLYGQGALGGAVNFVSRQPNAERTVIEGEAGYGSQNTAHVAAGIGGPVGETLSYRGDVSWRRSDGYVDRGRSRSIALSGAIRWAPTETFYVQLRDDYGNQHPIRYFGTPLINGQLDDSIRQKNYNVADASLHYRDNHTLLTAEWKASDAITFRNDAYRLTSKRLFKNLEESCYVSAPNGRCRNGGNVGSDNFDPAPAGTIYRYSNLGIIHDQTQYGDQGTVRVATDLGNGIRNDLLAGFDVNVIHLTYSNDFATDPQESVVNPYTFNPGLFFDTVGILPRYKTRTHEYAFFAEDRLKYGAFSLIGGVRYEHDNVTRSNIVYGANGSTTLVNAFPNGATEKNLHNVTYRVAGLYQPTANISLYAQYTTGVDPLGTLTTFTTNRAQFAFTNATGNQLEVGAKASFLDGRGQATFAAYRIVKKNLVAQRTATSAIEQVGQREAKGLEASLTVSLPKGFSIDANGTVLDAHYDDFISGGVSLKGKTPSNIPQAAGNLWLRWSSGKLAAQAGVRYVGHQYSDENEQFRIPGYATLDLGASYALTRWLAVDVHLYNVTNKDYVSTSYDNDLWILGRPRSVDVSLRARF